MPAGVNEICFNAATMNEIVEYYLNGKLFAGGGYKVSRVKETSGLGGVAQFEILFEKKDDEK